MYCMPLTLHLQYEDHHPLAILGCFYQAYWCVGGGMMVSMLIDAASFIIDLVMDLLSDFDVFHRIPYWVDRYDGYCATLSHLWRFVQGKHNKVKSKVVGGVHGGDDARGGSGGGGGGSGVTERGIRTMRRVKRWHNRWARRIYWTVWIAARLVWYPIVSVWSMYTVLWYYGFLSNNTHNTVEVDWVYTAMVGVWIVFANVDHVLSFKSYTDCNDYEVMDTLAWLRLVSPEYLRHQSPRKAVSGEGKSSKHQTPSSHKKNPTQTEKEAEAEAEAKQKEREEDHDTRHDNDDNHKSSTVKPQKPHRRRTKEHTGETTRQNRERVGGATTTEQEEDVRAEEKR
eukprot:TRINITY_DN6016_c0_g1_i1.p1 TRINITY_DN6016_c0_g1~~TRINITY_DN6016_c0_g1_i1.p1  ORF type:complete len:340 (-),score=52.33 TRINITY_DN6016_c0_g1_i1:42-1061(-)